MPSLYSFIAPTLIPTHPNLNPQTIHPPTQTPTLTTTLPSFLLEKRKEQETINPLLPHLITSYHNPYPIPQEKQPLYENHYP